MKIVCKTKSAFTLVELMIVVAVIGLLTAIALPLFAKSREGARNARYVGDLRVARQAFILYSMEQSRYPADTTPGIMPAGMQSYFGEFNWTGDTVIGGKWDWDYRVFGVTAGVSVYQPPALMAQMTAIDKIIDDGNLSTGSFRSRSAGYVSILE